MSKFNVFVILAAQVFLAVGGYFISQKIAQNAVTLKRSGRLPSSVGFDHSNKVYQDGTPYEDGFSPEDGLEGDAAGTDALGYDQLRQPNAAADASTNADASTDNVPDFQKQLQNPNAAAVPLDEQLGARIKTRQDLQAQEQALKKAKQEIVDELVERIKKDGFKVQLEDDQLIIEK